jgi:hypothetical protein
MSRLTLFVFALSSCSFASTLYTASGSLTNGGPACYSQNITDSECYAIYNVASAYAVAVPFYPIITPVRGTPLSLPSLGPIYGVSISVDVYTQDGIPQATASASATWNSNLIITGVSGAGTLKASFYASASDGEDCAASCSSGSAFPQLSIGNGSTTVSSVLGSATSEELSIPVVFGQPFAFHYSAFIPALSTTYPRQSKWSGGEVVLTGLSVYDANGNELGNAQVGLAPSVAPEPSTLAFYILAIIGLGALRLTHARS